MAVHITRDLGPPELLVPQALWRSLAAQARRLLLSLIFNPFGAVVNGDSEKALLEVTEDRF